MPAVMQHLLSVLSAVPALLPPAQSDVLDPKTHVSPSGELELFVDPSAADGSGPASYRLSRGAEVVWEGMRPFCLWDAHVTDTGAVLGHAYEGGVSSGHHGTAYSGLAVYFLAPDGEVLRRDPAGDHPKSSTGNGWAGGVLGTLHAPELDLFLVRVPGEEDVPVVWWTYRASTGESLGDVVPEAPVVEQGFLRELTLDLVPGTPLLLSHWFRYERIDGVLRQSATLTLSTPRGERVWKHELPGEYDGLPEDRGWWDLAGDGIEQVEPGEREFRFRSFGSASRLGFRVEPDAQAEHGWRVVAFERVEDDVARELEAAGEEALPPVVELVQLESLGTIELERPADEASPIGGVFDFSIDRDGALAFVRWGEEKGDVRFVRVSADGDVLTDAPLDLPSDEQALRPVLAHVAASRWVLLRATHAEDRAVRAWWLDGATAALEPIAGFEAEGSIESVQGTGDGGFQVLLSHHLEYTIRDEIVRYDDRGARLWSHLEPGYGQGWSFRALASVDGVGAAALTSDTIELFDTRGEHLRSLSLAEVLGREPSYPAGLAPDGADGLVLEDFRGSPPIHRIGLDGSRRASLQPAFADGRPLEARVQRVDPDGRLWTTDGHTLLRLDDEGVVDRTLGPKPEDDRLDEIEALTVGPDGRVYAINARTAAVHVFDRSGSALRVCRPPTELLAGTYGRASITLDGSGNVLYRAEGLAEGRYWGFAADGTPLDATVLSALEHAGEWLFQPGSSERWILRYKRIELVAPDGRRRRTIERRPDGRWLRSVDAAAVAPDGSLAVIDRSSGLFSRGGPPALCLYGPDGAPRRTLPLVDPPGFSRVAHAGTTVVTSSGNAAFLYDPEGGAARKLVLPGEGDDGWWTPFVTMGGTELWMHDAGSFRLLRYRLP